MAEREGQQFGNYRLTRLLGRGAFAEVYLAVQVYLGTEAAVKVLHTQLANPAEIEKFRLEARTIATLVHPNIVRLLDFGVQDNTPYLLMDYAPNGSLRQKFPSATPLAPASLVPYIKQVSEALQYAHDQRLVHRDVKPENMLLGRTNEVLLSDFGIAMVAQSSSYQETQGIAGTASYMAPEQLQGKPRPASDQYALGIVLYEWLSGARPFTGTFTEVAGQHMLAPPPPLLQKVPTLSPAIERVVLTALAKDPKDRFASMRAFATAFEQATQGAGQPVYETRLQAPPPGLIDPGIPTNQGLPSVYGAETVISTPPNVPLPAPIVPGGPGTIGGMATIPVPPPSGPSGYPPPANPGWGAPSGPPPYAQPANAGWAAAPAGPPAYGDTFSTGMQAPPSPFAPPPAQTPPNQGVSRRTVVVAGAAGLALIGGGAAAAFLLLDKNTGSPGQNLGATPTATASGSTSPTATSEASPTETATSSTPQPGDTVLTFLGHSQEVTSLAWSPNGKYIVSGSFDHTARVWDTTANKSIYTYTKHTDQIWAAAWSPNMKLIATGGKDKTVQIWDTTSSTEPRSNYTAHFDAVSGLAWAPDSVRIASASYDMTVRVWDALTQNFHYGFDGHTDRVWCVAWSPDGTRAASGGRDKTVWVWDPTGMEGSYTYTGHSDGVAAVAWSPDSKRVASGSYDNTVQVWDAQTGANAVKYTGHTSDITSVDWSPDGQFIASASKDGTVHVWNAGNASRVFAYAKHSGEVDCVGWAPGGQQIASGGVDKTVRVWLAP